MTDRDTHDQEDEVARAAIQLRTERFALMFAVLGITTDDEIAAAAGYSRRTITRARSGQLGEAFIANTIHVLQQRAPELAKYGLSPSLDELFEVVAAPAVRRAA